ncbi:hypothetical protein LQ327_00260 [Actinomycetospora endophytica]|uniref:Uncharacterized protein n=1 Tax=Actinomycetospora endophytica TaxID=2291215 RepID=A0ABS8P153_9PSEU|nr:hypothetical protein [Actinomycetospora endophytica]MCD2191824.1 hypothetical protein [Actinomycetospora endophytica]
MTGPEGAGQPRRPDLEAAADSTIPAEHAHRAALVVAANATGPDDARDLLDILGLLDRARPVLDTATAAEAVGITETALIWFALADIATPARTDPNRTRWWNVVDLHRQIDAYRTKENQGEQPVFGGQPRPVD